MRDYMDEVGDGDENEAKRGIQSAKKKMSHLQIRLQ
jgi:hypothetical protein